jgi:hypothetical protein
MIKSSVEFNKNEYHDTIIQLKHATSAELATANPVLQKAEMAVETDTNKFKFGDGEKAYNDLPYSGNGASPVGFKYGEYALSAHQTTNLGSGQKILFNQILNGSLPAPNNGVITLPAGKTYKIHFMPYLVFSNQYDDVSFQLYNVTDGNYFGMVSTSIAVTWNEDAQSQQNTIISYITTTKDTNIEVRMLNVFRSSLSLVNNVGTRLFIEEYAGY